MSRRSDPRELVSGSLAGLFLIGFILLFVWLLLMVWNDPGHLPRFTRTDTFTNVTTSMVGLVGGIAAARMGSRAARRGGFEGTFGWFYVIAYFLLGMAALITLVVNSSGGRADEIPEVVKNLGTVSFGLMIATVGSYLGSS